MCLIQVNDDDDDVIYSAWKATTDNKFTVNAVLCLLRKANESKSHKWKSNVSK